MDSNNNKNFERALVLSGGGAKGAYAFGCLKAFKERNIHFDAVSGTSVGGLNALLWSTKSLSEGQKLWDELSFSTVYPVRLLNPRIFPRPVIHILAMVIVFLNLILNTMKGVRHPARLATSLFLTVIGGFPWIIAVLVIVTSGFRGLLDEKYSNMFWGALGSIWGVISILAVTLGFLLFIFELWASFYDGGPQVSHSSCLIVVGLLPTFLFCGTWLMNRILPVSGFWSNVIFIVFCVALWVFTTKLPKIVLASSEYILGKVGTVLDSTPLHKTVASILSSKTVTIPTFVTTASVREVYDPDKKEYWQGVDYVGGLDVGWFQNFELQPRRLWVPHYTEISSLSPEQAALYCVASAALPFGIVPSVKLADGEIVDGGVIDNIPYYPFVEDVPAKEIYIVLLEPFKSDEEAQRISKISPVAWSKNERFQRVVKLPKPEKVPNYNLSQDAYRPETTVHYREIKDFPKLVFFYPRSESLGGFIKGTLNFNGKYARNIMGRGYLETTQKLDEMTKAVRS